MGRRGAVHLQTNHGAGVRHDAAGRRAHGHAACPARPGELQLCAAWRSSRPDTGRRPISTRKKSLSGMAPAGIGPAMSSNRTRLAAFCSRGGLTARSRSEASMPADTWPSSLAKRPIPLRSSRGARRSRPTTGRRQESCPAANCRSTGVARPAGGRLPQTIVWSTPKRSPEGDPLQHELGGFPAQDKSLYASYASRMEFGGACLAHSGRRKGIRSPLPNGSAGHAGRFGRDPSHDRGQNGGQAGSLATAIDDIVGAGRSASLIGADRPYRRAEQRLEEYGDVLVSWRSSK